MDWKSIVKVVAPTIATGLGGPLAGLATKALSEALLGTSDGTEDQVAQAVLGANPEQLLAIKNADQEFAKEMKRLDIDLDKEYIRDTSDARHVFAENKGVFWLGIAVLITFAAVMFGVLWGSFEILTGGITIKDIAIVATVSGLVGTVVGYVAANAQQVVSYFFGSSRGSADKTAAMSSAISRLGSNARPDRHRL